MPTDLDKAVGARIRARRNEMRLSVAALSARTGGAFKPSVLSAYERGDRALSIGRLIRLADWLDCSPAHLLPAEHGGRPLRITVEGDLAAALVAAITDTPIPYELNEVA